MFDPSLGRWLTADPIGYAGGDENLYRYEGGNPVNVTDPSGLQINPVPSLPWAPSGSLYNPTHVPPAPTPYFPNLQGVQTRSFKNAPTLTGGNVCLCPRDKKDRLSPIPGVTVVDGIVPVGASGGTHVFYGPPDPKGGRIGTGGCQGCVAVIIKCDDGVAVFHFTAGDYPQATLGHYAWGSKKCRAIICGGDDTHGSNCLASGAMSALKSAGIPLDGVSGGHGCGVNPDGSWYQSAK